MKAMTCLASGQWVEDVCRQQKVTEDDLDLFTAKLDDSTPPGVGESGRFLCPLLQQGAQAARLHRGHQAVECCHRR